MSVEIEYGDNSLRPMSFDQVPVGRWFRTHEADVLTVYWKVPGGGVLWVDIDGASMGVREELAAPWCWLMPHGFAVKLKND